MEILLNVVGPVAVLVSLGAIAGPRLDLSAGDLARLAYWVLGPAFVFDALATAELDAPTVARLVVAAVAGMVAAGAVAVVGTRALRADYPVVASAVMTSAYGNVGNAGLAISVFALGDSVVVAATIMMIVINVGGLMLGIGLAGARTNGVAGAIRSALSAPMTIGGVLALVFNVLQGPTGVELPLIIERSVALLAGALIPVMLFTLGMQLVAIGRPRPTPDLSLVIGAKLFVAPLVAGLVGAAVGLAGDDLDVAVIQSAMPPAVFCAVVAMEHDLEPKRVTTAVVLTTLASLITLPILIAVIT